MSAVPARGTSSALVAASILLAVALWTFWPYLFGMADRWQHDSRYSHGYLVPLFSLFLLWRQREHLTSEPGRAAWWGMAIFLVGLGIAAAGTYAYFDYLNALGLVVVLIGLSAVVGGWTALRAAWPALAFLLFMVPLPFQIEAALAHPLQRVATRVSVFCLQTLGFTAFGEGNTIRMGEVRLGVVEACSGLSMLMIFFALCTAVAILLRRPLWERLLIVACAVPIALLANIIRIVVTGVLHVVAGQKIADLVFHDLAGWLMMPLALGMLWAGYRLFCWAFPLHEVETGATESADFAPPRRSFHRPSPI